jgi:hypothetical protein
LVVNFLVILPDLTRLVSEAHFHELMESGFSQEYLIQEKILPIHRDFRIIAVGETPTKTNDYITHEVASLFSVCLLFLSIYRADD